MIGLFQEHGPCRLNNDSTALDYNPYSWNNVSNVSVVLLYQNCGILIIPRTACTSISP